MRHLPEHSQRQTSRTDSRRGFTLVELLVVVAIILVMAGMTLAVWNSTANADRIRSAARQVQSAILGARDRAIYAPRVSSSPAAQRRGLRLIRNSDDNTSPETVKSFVFVQSNDPIRFGSFYLDSDPLKQSGTYLRIVRHTDGQKRKIYVYPNVPNGGPPYLTAPDPNPTGPPMNQPAEVYIPGQTSNRGTSITAAPSVGNSIFRAMQNRNLLPNETRARLTIGAYSENFTVDTSLLSVDGSLLLTDEIAAAGEWNGNNGTTTNTPQSIAYEDGPAFSIGLELETPATAVPGEEPLKLPAGSLISFAWSQNLPSDWFPGTSEVLDIMYSPRGSLAGALKSQGIVHLMICNETDLLANPTPAASPAAATPNPEWLIVTIYTQTGQIITSPVNLTDPTTAATGNDNGLPLQFDEIFYNAKSGEVANR